VTLDDFKRSTSTDRPPASLSRPLLALWHDARGDWAAAHKTAQEIKDATGSWIHAYLHRKEGDLGNAGYWYNRAGKPECRTSLDAEWEEIAAALLVAAANDD
jgi:hypothetical protein